MILLPTYLTYLTYYNPPLLESSASSSSAGSAHMPGRGKTEGQYMDTYGNCEVRKKHGKLGGTSILGVPPLDTAARDGAVRYGADTPRPMRCSPITSYLLVVQRYRV